MYINIMHASILNELLISSSQVGDVNKVHTDPDKMSLAIKKAFCALLLYDMIMSKIVWRCPIILTPLSRVASQ